METKELKIQAPEGYEIDKENFTFECIKFKPVKKNITYKDICNKILKNKINYYITTSGNIEDTTLEGRIYDKNNATSKKQLEKLLALNQLLNIAEYYNKQHPGFDVSYRIYYDKSTYCYNIACYTGNSNKFSLETLFNKREDAQAVINNPNFREILNTIYKD